MTWPVEIKCSFIIYLVSINVKVKEYLYWSFKNIWSYDASVNGRCAKPSDGSHGCYDSTTLRAIFAILTDKFSVHNAFRIRMCVQQISVLSSFRVIYTTKLSQTHLDALCTPNSSYTYYDSARVTILSRRNRRARLPSGVQR